MNGSVRVATIFGIGVYIHWTFLLWLGIVFYNDYTASGLNAGLGAVIFTIALFICVVMHEYGHALTARAFGIRTRDITIMMLGGVARLMAFRTTPTRELLITIAGPAVNVAIAGVLLPVVLYTHAGSAALQADFWGGDLWERLLIANVILVVFNMIPCFPMDGGRVLRAVLAYMMSYVNATTVAARVGQVIAAIFVILGLWSGQIMLALIGFFVFTGAQRELAGAKAQDAMAREGHAPEVPPRPVL